MYEAHRISFDEKYGLTYCRRFGIRVLHVAKAIGHKTAMRIP
jgi:hypothetical protein